jgi:hypothetical protein
MVIHDCKRPEYSRVRCVRGLAAREGADFEVELSIEGRTVEREERADPGDLDTVHVRVKIITPIEYDETVPELLPGLCVCHGLGPRNELVDAARVLEIHERCPRDFD